MKLKTIHLVFCALGLILPYWHFVPWVLRNGLSLRLFFDQLFANNVSGFFGMDVIVSAAVLLVLIMRKARGLQCSAAGSQWSRPWSSESLWACRCFSICVNARSSRGRQGG